MILKLDHIYKDYNTDQYPVHVLKDVSLHVEKGDYVAIMGPSGSGKSTLMNIIGCLDSPTTGTYDLDGQNVLHLTDNQLADIRCHKIGFVFQTFQLLSAETAVQNVMLPLSFAGVKRNERRDIAVKALERVGLGDRVDFLPTQLSGGQKQRVAIARALVNNPQILLADEPTGALDQKSGADVMDLFERLNEEGVTVIVITHDRHVAARAHKFFISWTARSLSIKIWYLMMKPGKQFLFRKSILMRKKFIGRNKCSRGGGVMKKSKNEPAVNNAPLGAKKKKKLSKKGIIALVIVGVVAVGAVYGLQQARANNSKVYVSSVEENNMDWVRYNETTSGTISDAASQNIYLEASDVVSQVFVTEGQEVAAGDALFQYDTEALSLDLESKQLNVTYQQQQLETAKQQLTQYENIKVSASQAQTPEPEPTIIEYQLTQEQLMPAATSGDGSEEDPYYYVCGEETLVDAETWNGWIEEAAYVILAVGEDQWEFGAECMPYLDDETYMSVSSRRIWQKPDPEIIYPEEPEPSNEVTYTQEEKTKLINDQKQTIAQLENSIKSAQIAVEQSQAKLNEATVTAAIPGVIKKIADPQNPPNDGSAFCVVSSQDGAGVTGYISELELDQYKEGDTFTVSSWMSGASTEATIVSISDYPATDGYVNGNSNASVYQFTAYMDDASDFETGEDVEISPNYDDSGEFICLEKGYVRSDNEGNYVMIDDNGRLKKQRVTVGKTYEGQYIEVKSGLSTTDMIAFPYGKNVKEGAKTTDEYTFSLF